MFASRMNLSTHKLALTLCLLLLGHPHAAHAEKEDRNKPLNIESDRLSVDDSKQGNNKQVSTFEGKVQLTQGTLRVLADKLVVTEDAAGQKNCVATGRLASFRQKREAVNEYIEGYGERIEYDTHTESVDFYVHARVKRAQDDVRGDHITYSTQTELFHVNGGTDRGRVHATIQPKSKNGQVPAKAAEPKADQNNPAPKKPGQ